VTVLARAWDDTAPVQPESDAQLWNPKAYADSCWSKRYLTAEA
jgi:sulfite oxidase